MQTKNWKEGILIMVGLLIAAGFIAFTAHSCIQCWAAGGSPVEGMFHIVCVKE